MVLVVMAVAGLARPRRRRPWCRSVWRRGSSAALLLPMLIYIAGSPGSVVAAALVFMEGAWEGGRRHGRRHHQLRRSQGAHGLRGSSGGDFIHTENCCEPHERCNWPGRRKTKEKVVSLEPRERRSFAPDGPGSQVGQKQQTRELQPRGAVGLLGHPHKHTHRD